MTTTTATSTRTTAMTGPAASEAFVPSFSSVNEARDEAAVAFFNSTARVGYGCHASRTEVENAQRILSFIGYPVSVTGRLMSDDPNDSTIAAIHEFQANRGLLPTGVIDARTRVELHRFATTTDHPPLWIDELRAGLLGDPSNPAPEYDATLAAVVPGFAHGASIAEDLRLSGYDNARETILVSRAVVRAVLTPAYAVADTAPTLFRYADLCMAALVNETNVVARVGLAVAWFLALMIGMLVWPWSFFASLVTNSVDTLFMATGLPANDAAAAAQRAAHTNERSAARASRATDLRTNLGVRPTLGTRAEEIRSTPRQLVL